MDLGKHVHKVEAKDVDITLLGYPVVGVDDPDTSEWLSTLKTQPITLEGFYESPTAGEAAERIVRRAAAQRVTICLLRWPSWLFSRLAWCLERLHLGELRYRWCYRKYEIDPERITLEFTRDIEG